MDQAVAAAQRAHRRLTILVVVLACLAGSAAMGLSFWLTTMQTAELPVEDSARQFLPTAHDLLTLDVDLEVRTDAERLSKRKQADDVVVLQYAYEHPDAATTTELRSSIWIAPDEEVAEATYQQRLKELSGYAGGPSETRNQAVSGDQKSQLELVRRNGRLVALMYVGRRGNRVFCFAVQGLQLLDAYPVLQLLESAVAQMESYPG